MVWRGLAWCAGGTFFVLALANTPIALAAESGSALYIGGSQAFGAGATPPPGTYGTIGTIYYDGNVGAVVAGGLVDLNVRKKAFASVANLLHVWPGGIAGGRFGVSASLPFASYANLTATAAGAVTGNLQTDGWGIGDLSLKAQNGWSHGSFSHTVSVTMWAPTGRYDTGFSPNAGKNHVGFDFGWAFTQIWANPGIELSMSLGYSVELENPATSYRNGDTFHLEAALGYKTHSGWTLGAASYLIYQVTGDSGSGALLGPFRREVYAAGPALSYSGVIAGKAFNLTARHYWEFDARNTFEGHISFVTGTVKF